jgi:hypothetical protein
LLPLQPKEIDLLLDQALAETSVNLSESDRAYISRVSGRHPYLVQMAAAALFEVVTQGKSEQTRYEEAAAILRGWADAHFNDLWRCLHEKARAAIAILALMEIDSSGILYKSAVNPLGTLEQHDVELRWLADGGIIEPTDEKKLAVMWQGGRWRISAESFARWIIDTRKWEELTPVVGMPQPVDRRRAEEIAALQEQVDAHQNRLHLLQLQEAKKGIGADPAITIEIKEIEVKIADIKRQIQALQR